MDPEANLEEQRKLAEEILDAVDGGRWVPEAAAARLSELVLALRTWRTTGGWDPHRTPESGNT